MNKEIARRSKKEKTKDLAEIYNIFPSAVSRIKKRYGVCGRPGSKVKKKK